jgi:hypothetical protein
MTDVAVDPGERHAVARRDREAGAAGRLVGLAFVAGLTLEIGLRGGVRNAVVVAGLALVAATLLTGGRLRRRQARVMAVATLVPVAFLAVRASPWLAWSNLAVGAALLGASVLYGATGTVLDATPRRVAQRGAAAVDGAVRRMASLPDVLPRTTPPERAQALRLAKALAVTLPVLGVLVALLASADAVFASLLTPDVNLGPLAGHVALALLLTLGVLILASAASTASEDWHGHGGFGPAEVATMLALAAFVLGLFVVSQLVALTDAGHRLVESAGLTPAEYARSGFFQLCWAAGLVLAFMWLVRSLAAPEALAAPIVRGLGATVPALALGLVVVSLRRMSLYDQAFGLTMLRLWVVGAAVWMGSVLVMTAVRNAGSPAGRNWIVAGAGISAAALVLMADVSNPEAFVARHNLARAREGAELDVSYLVDLSDDAVPVLADALGGKGGTLRCSPSRRGVAALNLAVSRADDVRRDLCGP